MKIPITMKAAALALAGVVLGANQASALLYTQGDILLGFRLNDNSGVSTYLVDLGSASQLTALAPGASLSFGSISTIGQDLVDTYGANWYTLGDLAWGAFGSNTNTSNTLYATRARSAATPGTPAASYPFLAAGSTRNNATTPVLTAEGGFSNAVTTLTTSSTNTANAGFQTATTQGTYWFAVNPTPDFGGNAGWSSIEGSGTSGITSTILDLQRPTTSPTTTLGSFTIDNTGVVTFTAAIPEPSTYALIALSGVIFMVFLRRRSIQA